MIPLRENLRQIVIALVKEREEYHDYDLAPIDQTFIVETLTDFTFEAIDKYIRGGKEHNPEREGSFVMDVDHELEMSNEIVDQLMYSRAARFKRLNK